MKDPRAGLADYYDLKPTYPDDIPFYLDQLPEHGSSVLELGCGTGRVSVALASRSKRFVGIDHSEEMAGRCSRRLAEAGLLGRQAEVKVADITAFRLNESFDLIVAPFRVLQNLETDEQVRGLLAGIRRHLSSAGRCILNAFCPNRSPAEFLESWAEHLEVESWSIPTDDGRIVCLDRRAGIKRNPLILYPELVYRRYRGRELVDEAILSIAMRCYYPQELLDLVRSEGFRVTQVWGGYAGEVYGEGPELVVEFGSEA